MTSHVQWLDAEPERTKQQEKERVKLHLAVDRAVDLIHESIGSCPANVFNWDNNCEEKCGARSERRFAWKECWRDYLLREES